MLKRKRKTKQELEAEILRLADRVKKAESVNAVATKTIDAYVPRVTDSDILWIGIPALNDCHEVRP